MTTGPGGRALASDAVGYLRGIWRVERRLVDHAAGSFGTFDGVARFTALEGPAEDGGAGDCPAGYEPAGVDSAGYEPAEDCPTGRGPVALAYHEDGELRFRGYSGPASRRLIYRGRPDGAADVCFADGREFYRLDPRSGSWQGQHQCGRDRYTVTGQLLDAGSFQERWRARGPEKDYEITTTLIRSETGRP